MKRKIINLISYIMDDIKPYEKEKIKKMLKEEPILEKEAKTLKQVWEKLDIWEIETIPPPLIIKTKIRRFPILYPAIGLGIAGLLIGFFVSRIDYNRYYHYVSYIERGFYEK